MRRSRRRSRRRSSPGPAPLRRSRPRAPRRPWPGPPRPSRRDVRVAVADQRGRLEIRVAESPGDLERRLRVAVHLLGGGRRVRRDASASQPCSGTSPALAEQALGPREPARAHRVVAVGRREFAGEPERASRPPARVVRVLPVGGVRRAPCARWRRRCRAATRARAETLLAPGPTGVRSASSNAARAAFPVAAGKRLVSRGEGIGGGVDRHDRRMMTRAGMRSARAAAGVPACSGAHRVPDGLELHQRRDLVGALGLVGEGVDVAGPDAPASRSRPRGASASASVGRGDARHVDRVHVHVAGEPGDELVGQPGEDVHDAARDVRGREHLAERDRRAAARARSRGRPPCSRTRSPARAARPGRGAPGPAGRRCRPRRSARGS